MVVFPTFCPEAAIKIAFLLIALHYKLPAMSFPIEELKEWFLENRRPLPWRENVTAYRVWISEVMLQQTQASVVSGYFERWMHRFPTLASLANAASSEVIKLWEGLGYYSRARHLHEGAKQILEKWGGVFPSTPEALLEIKGIGSYTQGAILSFAFHQKWPAVDGNVIRVLSRFLALHDPVDLPKTRGKIEAFAWDLLPEVEPWVITEALIELGALICQKKPLCQQCPLQSKCQGYRQQVAQDLPQKSRKVPTTHLFRAVGVIEHEGAFLVRKGKGELYEFPFVELEKPPSFEAIQPLLEKELGLSLELEKQLPFEKHAFTRYLAHLFPIKCRAFSKSAGLWVKEPSQYPFSAGHRRILKALS